MAMLTALLLLGPPAQPAGAITAAVGVCELELDLTSSTVEPVHVGLPSWTVVGHGSCTVGPDEEILASLTGALTGATGPGSCALGAYQGNLELDVAPNVEDVASLVGAAVMAGPVLTVTMAAAPLPALVGTGVFVELSTGATGACVTSTGNTTRTWSGVFMFGGVGSLVSPSVKPDSGASR